MSVIAESRLRPLRIAVVSLLCTLTYLLVKAKLAPELYENTPYLLKDLGISIFLGIVAFVCIAGYYWWTHLLENRWLKKIGPLDLFKICNDASSSVHTGICNMFSSDDSYSDDSQSLFLGGQPDCFIYSFGLVTISMNKLDKNFLQSATFNEFKSRVLQRLVNLSKEKYSTMNLDMTLAEEQLKKTKAKDIQNMMIGIEYYKEQSAAKNADPLTLLVRNLSERTRLKGADNLQSLTAISNRILKKIDNLILSYKK